MEQSSEKSSSNGVEIVLSRGTAGLGFNIRGGVDNPHIPGDSGIFVTKVRENGAAFVDGRLKEGDKILAINGKSLESVTHEEAVQCFTRARDTVKLLVHHGAQAEITRKRAQQKNTESSRKDEPKSSYKGKLMAGAIVVAGLAVGGYFLYKRITKGPVNYR